MTKTMGDKLCVCMMGIGMAGSLLRDAFKRSTPAEIDIELRDAIALLVSSARTLSRVRAAIQSTRISRKVSR